MAANFGIEFVLEGTGESLFHNVTGLYRVPQMDEYVHLGNLAYKVERVETYYEDNREVNPHSGRVAPWALSKEICKITLSVVI